METEQNVSNNCLNVSNHLRELAEKELKNIMICAGNRSIVAGWLTHSATTKFGTEVASYYVSKLINEE